MDSKLDTQRVAPGLLSTCHNLFNEVSTVASRTPLGSTGVGGGNLFLRRAPAPFSAGAGVTSTTLSKGHALPSCTSGDALPACHYQQFELSRQHLTRICHHLRGGITPSSLWRRYHTWQLTPPTYLTLSLSLHALTPSPLHTPSLYSLCLHLHHHNCLRYRH